MKPEPNRFLHSDSGPSPLTCRKMLPIRQTLNPLKIRAGHKSVLIEVCELFENGGRNSCDISNKKLGERLGRHEVTVSHSLTWLQQAGLLTIVHLPEQGNRRQLIPSEMVRSAYVLGDSLIVAAHLGAAPSSYQPASKRGALSETLRGDTNSETLRPLSVDAKTLLANGYDPLSVDAKTCLQSVYNQSTISHNQAAADASEPVSEKLVEISASAEEDTSPEPANAQASHTRGAALRFPAWATDTFRAEWAEWLAFRQSKRDKLKPPSQQKLLDKLASFDEGFCHLLFDKAISNGYTGLVFDDTPAKYELYKRNQSTPYDPAGNGNQPRTGHKSETLADLGDAVDQYFALKYGH